VGEWKRRSRVVRAGTRSLASEDASASIDGGGVNAIGFLPPEPEVTEALLPESQPAGMEVGLGGKINIFPPLQVSQMMDWLK